jgi:hypothetical protein
LSGGKLMCETRNESRLANSSRNTQQDDEGETRPPRPRRRTSSGPPHRIRGGGPLDVLRRGRGGRVSPSSSCCVLRELFARRLSFRVSHISLPPLKPVTSIACHS